MGFINYRLSNSGSLHTLASPGPGAAGTLPVGMAAVGGLYLIYNHANVNRYIGKTGDMQDRFNGRMLTINEFGFSQANLGQMGVFWGDVLAYNTPVMVPPALIPPMPPLALGFHVLRNAGGAAPPMTPAYVGLAAAAPNYGANAVTTTVDGQAVNVEALLIRFFKQALGAGGTVTNGHYINNFQNPTIRELIVQVEWAACPVVGVPQGHFAIVIPAGGNF